MALANNLGTQSVSTPSPTFKAGSPYTPSRTNNVTSAGRIASGGSNGSYADILRAISDQNNAFNVAQTEYVNAFNAREAQKNRDWQEYMARNAHQIEVEDLRKAGLNPVLSALNGNGATVGSGASASGQKAVADNTLGNGIISMLSAMINASSAATVASIYANASMYAADRSAGASKYSVDTNALVQAAHDNTSSRNTDKNSDTAILNNIIRLLGSGVIYKGYEKFRR